MKVFCHGIKSKIHIHLDISRTLLFDYKTLHVHICSFRGVICILADESIGGYSRVQLSESTTGIILVLWLLYIYIFTELDCKLSISPGVRAIIYVHFHRT
jgi:hypothetical protein